MSNSSTTIPVRQKPDGPLPVRIESHRATVPVLIARNGENAARRFLEFFAATIRNKNTRAAYYLAVNRFFAWCEQNAQLHDLVDIEPLHVAAYIEGLQNTYEKPSVKQHLSAIRMCFDWLVIGHIVVINPAHAVRGPTHVVKRGKTPVLTAEQPRQLLDSIPTDTLIGLRDKALISVMCYAFARIGAVVTMRVEDYYPEGKRWWLRLHEKGGKRHEMPCHHKLEAYLEAADLGKDKRGPLFRPALKKTGTLSEKRLSLVDAWRNWECHITLDSF